MKTWEVHSRVLARHFTGSVPGLVAISGIFLVGQVAATDYGSGGAGQGAFWLLVGLLMLWLVLKRGSRLARAFVVVTAFLGAAIFAVAALTASGRTTGSALLVALYVGQAVPLLMPPIRAHVGKADRGVIAGPAPG